MLMLTRFTAFLPMKCQHFPGPGPSPLTLKKNGERYQNKIGKSVIEW